MIEKEIHNALIENLRQLIEELSEFWGFRITPVIQQWLHKDIIEPFQRDFNMTLNICKGIYAAFESSDSILFKCFCISIEPIITQTL